jgi:hypothetical protein
VRLEAVFSRAGRLVGGRKMRMIRLRWWRPQTAPGSPLTKGDVQRAALIKCQALDGQLLDTRKRPRTAQRLLGRKHNQCGLVRLLDHRHASNCKPESASVAGASVVSQFDRMSVRALSCRRVTILRDFASATIAVSAVLQAPWQQR